MKHILVTWLTRCRMLVIQWWEQLNASTVVQKQSGETPNAKVLPMNNDEDAVADLAEQIVLFVYMLLKQTGTKPLTPLI